MVFLFALYAELMTCLFNARAYRDRSAAAPRRPDTSYWVLGCRGLVREHLVPRVQGAGLPRRGTTCQGVPTAIAPLKDLENFCNQYIFLVRPRVRGWVRGWVRGGSGGGSGAGSGAGSGLWPLPDYNQSLARSSPVHCKGLGAWIMPQ